MLPYSRTNLCLIDVNNSIAILDNFYINSIHNENFLHSIDTEDNFTVDKILISCEGGGLDINSININNNLYIKDYYNDTLFTKYKNENIIVNLDLYDKYKNEILFRTILINFIGLFIVYFLFYKLLIAYIVGSICGFTYQKSLQTSLDSNIYYISLSRYIIFTILALSIIDNDINNLLIFFIAFSINKIALISVSNDKNIEL